jgi:hypothetical protein
MNKKLLIQHTITRRECRKKENQEAANKEEKNYMKRLDFKKSTLLN